MQEEAKRRVVTKRAGRQCIAALDREDRNSLAAGAFSIEFVAVSLERKSLFSRDVVLGGLDLF
jgi:hypothetical protein